MKLLKILVLLGFVSAPAMAEEATAKLSTSAGVIELKLFVDQAPATVGNFIELARQGFYNGSRFHRVIPGHSLVGGAPKDAAAGSGPGYCFSGDSPPELTHAKAGIVSMVSFGEGTLGSQFQITLGPAPDLDGRAPVFAAVIRGQDIVEKLAAGKIDSSGKLDGAVIEKIEISGAFAPPAFNKTPELDAASLSRLLTVEATTLATNVGKSLNLGKLETLVFESGRSRCAESQALFRAAFKKSRDAHLLIYARARDDGATIRQFQFERGTEP